MEHPSSVSSRRRQILAALRERSGGATRQELQVLAGLEDLDEQAVRRLLAQLVEQGAVQVSGQTKARRYLLVEATADDSFVPAVAEGPPLSEAGEACRAFLAQPLSQRPAVGHNEAFLLDYRPNESAYLAIELRRRLAGLAPVPQAGPARPWRRGLLAEQVWDSVRLEGGSFTRMEIQRLIEQGDTPAGKPLRETQMVLNHLAAIAFMVESGREIAVDAITVQNLSALLTENLLADPGGEGRLRSEPSPILDSAYSPPADPRTISDGFRRLLDTAAAISDPFEQSFFLLVHLAYLRPFSAGHTALARLAADIPFLRRNGVPIAFPGIPAGLFNEAVLAVCERNEVALLRDLFLAALERSWAAHAAAPAALPLPDPFRLQYRAEIKAAVREVVLAGEAEPEQRIRAHAQARLPREARARFLAAVEAELASLHDGNFARYQLRPSEFAAWKPRLRRR